LLRRKIERGKNLGYFQMTLYTGGGGKKEHRITRARRQKRKDTGKHRKFEEVPHPTLSRLKEQKQKL